MPPEPVPTDADRKPLLTRERYGVRIQFPKYAPELFIENGKPALWEFPAKAEDTAEMLKANGITAEVVVVELRAFPR